MSSIPDGNPLAKARNQQGMTLVELMIALVFIAIGILALSAVQMHSVRDVYATGRHTRALELAEMRMEAARAAGYAAAIPDSAVSGPFTWVTQVSQAGTNLRQVTTTVRWNESGVPRSVRLVSLLSSR